MADEFLYALLSEDFQSFIEKSFTEIHGPGKYVPAEYIAVVCHHIERAIVGEERRLLFNLPPRHLKSFIVSVALPIFLLGKDPRTQVLLATYGEKLSQEHAIKAKKVMETKWYKSTFPNTKIDKGSATDLIRTTQGGYLRAPSVGGAVTGFGADFLLVDDLVKADASAHDRKVANDWFVNTALTRFNDPKIGIAIIACHRTHADDLTAYATASGKWTHLSFPVVATKHETFPRGNGSQFERHPGDPLHPGRFDVKDLADMKEELGGTFAAQYQQSPEAGVDTLFEKSWFKPLKNRMNLNNYEYRVHSWDAASSISATSSYSVCTIYGVAGDRVDLLHTFRKRVKYPQLVKNAWRLIRDFPPTHIIVENASAGQSLLQDLFEDLGHGIILHNPKQTKEARAETVLTTLRRKSIHVLEDAEWTETFLSEVLAFPNGFYDDQVDSLTQFLLHYQRGFGYLYKLDQDRLFRVLTEKSGPY